MRLQAYPSSHAAGQWAWRAWARRVLAFACACGGMSAQAAPDATALASLQQAEARMQGLATLRGQARNVGWQATSLEQAADSTGGGWQDTLTADKEAGVALQRAADCLADMRKGLAASGAVLLEMEQAVALSHRAAEAVASARGARLARATAQSDSVATRRAAAERKVADYQRGMADAVVRCARDIHAADQAQDRALGRAQEFARQAGALSEQLRRLRSEWEKALAGHRAAKDASWLAYEAAPIALPIGDRIGDLERVLANPPAREAAIETEMLDALARRDANLQRITSDLARLQDAAAYIDLAVGPRIRTCRDATCRSFAAERRGIALRLGVARAALAAARTRLDGTQASLDDLLEPLRAGRLAFATYLQPVAAATSPALDEAVAGAGAVRPAAEALEHAADTAHAQARREWESAYLLAYGRPPAPTAAAAPRPPPPPPPPPPALAGAPGPDLRSHAYEYFRAWDEEPRDFGAYTYVLVRNASDLQNPSVLRRFRQLLATLRKLPEARLVRPDEAKSVNLFCIPGTPAAGRDDESPDLSYDNELGQQLKLRAQNGLLARKDVGKRLMDSPGPFLITLPVRISKMTSDKALLFADLSRYPDDAIADLVANYMNGLVDKFPDQQALWKPSVPQRVALTMIRLAASAEQVVSNVIPSAMAQPR